MGWILIIAGFIVLFIAYTPSKNKSIENEITVRGNVIKKNELYIYKNNQRVTIATFSDGNVFMVGYQGKEYKIGRYDEAGKVYNSDDNMIGFMMSGTRMIISREFRLDFFRKQFSGKLRTPQLTYNLGEVLGSSSGTIFEADINGRDQYEKGVAYYETVDKNLMGVGAAYLLLVYEEIVESPHSKQFKMEASEVL